MMDDRTLAAYADDALTPDAARKVKAAIAADPVLAARCKALRAAAPLRVAKATDALIAGPRKHSVAARTQTFLMVLVLSVLLVIGWVSGFFDDRVTDLPPPALTQP